VCVCYISERLIGYSYAGNVVLDQISQRAGTWMRFMSRTSIPDLRANHHRIGVGSLAVDERAWCRFIFTNWWLHGKETGK
jgi:hypothetical protein